MTRIFANLMMEGKVRAALRIVTDSNGNGTLPLDKVVDPESETMETVHDILLKKHPPKQPPKQLNWTHHPQNHTQSCLR